MVRLVIIQKAELDKNYKNTLIAATQEVCFLFEIYLKFKVFDAGKKVLNYYLG